MWNGLCGAESNWVLASHNLVDEARERELPRASQPLWDDTLFIGVVM
jgi:hypothetical protein